MESKHIRLIIEVFVLASLLTAAVIYHQYVAGMSIPMLALLTISSIMALLLVTAAASWLYSQPAQILR
jgi:hypothetical protein